ncbi:MULTISPECIES: prepilin-type N-terminal cleavage/methylation domain-containing protein [Edwardsiella]|uniref:Prepilin peptidase dependent protein A n=2 Tax=Edwardsiella anguillarum TaxID=1821960 RepID=A0A076LK58_9GAMM|nr:MULTISPECIES: prepilin-type N-terminal cleavage/methylation domain-containing protein [Edwardsiella]AKM49036.1 peptidase [Edwardsiella sp. EA181011]GAJ66800.1 prepilin peptidase dependent protein A [Edwardsiella piscicida]AIJ08910.1 Prepilin peptidase dependent protein A precursor [Edwardsiella anguillarum ET080813]AKR79306.1 prepilin-type N-terminal cleavage/methylation domain-containing protein [Edwardsiella sp. LADL05-105]KAB0592330.1 prepilin-type N-terminal cleavage/methylation domain-
MREAPRGYTLLEVMLVCGVLAMLAAAALPLWLPRRDQQRMLAEGLRLQTYLLTLREQAFRSNGGRPILFRRGRGGVACLVAQPQDDCRAAAAFIPIAPLRLEAQMSADAGFYGVRNTARPGHLRLSDERRAVRVIWSAQGRVRLCAEYGVSALTACDVSGE